MFLVVCDIEDAGALWFAQQLRNTGVSTLVATSDLLSFARRRSQRVSIGGVESVVELADGATIARPDFVLNRLTGPPSAAWRWASAGERNYAIAELNAFVLGWLAGLECPVRNRPDPSCLAGPAPHPLVLAAAAARAGLDCADVTFVRAMGSPAHYLLESAACASGRGARPVHGVCLDGEILNVAVPPHVAKGVRNFAIAVGVDEALVGIDFLVQEDKWWFAGMSPVADLRVGGAPLLDRLLSLAMERAL